MATSGWVRAHHRWSMAVLHVFSSTGGLKRASFSGDSLLARQRPFPGLLQRPWRCRSKAQFRSDKSGLSLAARSKRGFLAQKGLILLTDLTHNLLADFYHRALVGTRFEAYGLKRILRELLATPGRLVLDGAGKLERIELLSLKQFASDLLICLKRYCLSD